MGIGIVRFVIPNIRSNATIDATKPDSTNGNADPGVLINNCNFSIEIHKDSVYFLFGPDNRVDFHDVRHS
jgi:hypothetical protein